MTPEQMQAAMMDLANELHRVYTNAYTMAVAMNIRDGEEMAVKRGVSAGEAAARHFVRSINGSAPAFKDATSDFVDELLPQKPVVATASSMKEAVNGKVAHGH